jgi:hypothetical protein
VLFPIDDFMISHFQSRSHVARKSEVSLITVGFMGKSIQYNTSIHTSDIRHIVEIKVIITTYHILYSNYVIRLAPLIDLLKNQTINET